MSIIVCLTSCLLLSFIALAAAHGPHQLESTKGGVQSVVNAMERTLAAMAPPDHPSRRRGLALESIGTHQAPDIAKQHLVMQMIAGTDNPAKCAPSIAVHCLVSRHPSSLLLLGRV
jgi:hypothetical protein